MHKFFRYETYKEGLQINFSTGYIDPEDMISESYPPINQQTRELYEENQDGSYQDKVSFLYLCTIFINKFILRSNYYDLKKTVTNNSDVVIDSYLYWAVFI